jgi:hypothetical protein
MIDKGWLLIIIAEVLRICIYIYIYILYTTLYLLGMIIVHELGMRVHQPSIWEIAY